MPATRIVALLTENDWLKEIERLSAKQADGFSVSELAASAGHGPDWARRMIRKGIDAGRLEFAGQRSRTDISGRASLTPVYRLVR